MRSSAFDSQSDRRLALTIYLFFVGLYLLGMGGHFYSIDDVARFDLLRGMLEHGTVEIPPTYSASHVTHDGRVFCKYGLGRPLAVIPLYYLGKAFAGAEIPGFAELNLEFWLSLFDQLITPLLLVFLYFIVRRLGYRKRTAFLTAVAGGAGTMLWMMSKYSFEHTLDATLGTAAILLLLRFRDRPRWLELALAGLALGWIGLTRIIDLAGFLPAVSLYVVYLLFKRHPSSWPKKVGRLAAFVMPLALCVAIVLAYNYYRFNDLFEFGYDDDAFSLRTAYVALIGYTISPGKGLFVFSPVLLLLIWAVRPFLRKNRPEGLLLLGLVLGLFSLYVQHLFWHGDWCMGPRFLTPLVPPLLVLLAAFFERPEFEAGRFPRYATWFLIALGSIVQLSCVAIDFNWWCAKYQLDLNGARFYPGYSPVVQNWAFILNGETSLWFRDLFASSAAPFARLLVLIPLGLLAFGAPEIARLKLELLSIEARDILRPSRWSFLRVSRLPQAFRSGRLRLESALGRGGARLVVIAVTLILLTGLLKALSPLFDREPPDHYLVGHYFPNPRWQGEPNLVRIDRTIDFDFNREEVRPNQGAFSAEWEGNLYAPEAGSYKFFLDSDDGSFLYLDGNLVIDNDGIHGMRQIIRSWHLDRGTHKIRVRYFDSGMGSAGIKLAWLPPGEKLKRIIPARAFTPEPAETYLRALDYHVNRKWKDARRLYNRLSGTHDVGVDLAASANSERALEESPPLLRGLAARADGGSGLHGIGFLDPDVLPLLHAISSQGPADAAPEKGGTSDESPDRRPGQGRHESEDGGGGNQDGKKGGSDPSSRDLELEGFLYVPFEGRYEIHPAGSIPVRVEIDSKEWTRDFLESGPVPIAVRGSPAEEAPVIDLAWSGDRVAGLRPIPRSLLSTYPASNPKEIAALLWRAGEEEARNGERIEAARLFLEVLRHDRGQLRRVETRLADLVLKGWWRRIFEGTEVRGEALIEGYDKDGPQRDFNIQRPLRSAFAADWSGQLVIEKAGFYEFFLASDDGSALFIDGTLLIDNGGIHGMNERWGGVELTAGHHAIEVHYFDSGFGAAGIRLRWKRPGSLFREDLASDLVYRPAIETPAAADLALARLFHAFGPIEDARVLYARAVEAGGLSGRDQALRDLQDAHESRPLDPARLAELHALLGGTAFDGRFPNGRRLFDLESGRYARWSSSGTAFGLRPARGSIDQQNEIRYWEGRYLLNSFHQGSDAATGTILSAPFAIDRRRISFLIGGSGHIERVRAELLVDGEVRRTATGNFSEFLERRSWSAAELRGKTARIRVIDESSDEWGHILFDDVWIHD